MQDKSERHSRILKLVRAQPIGTQTQLQAHLAKEGFNVNQATLSRDVNELGLIKVTIDGKARYAEKEEISSSPQGVSLKNLAHYVQDLDYSQNLIVLKTSSGAASHVAEALDNAGLQGIIGTIAGDNAILIVAAQDHDPQSIISAIRKELQSNT